MPLLSDALVKSGLQCIPLIYCFIIICFRKKNHHFYMKAILFPQCIAPPAIALWGARAIGALNEGDFTRNFYLRLLTLPPDLDSMHRYSDE
jgi:hypothetical protein